jgi:geranylgeranyl reductase
MPVTYEGIYYAMKSGELAATAIAEGTPLTYRKLWDERFRRRFTVMSMIRGNFFKSEHHIEKWVSLHRRPEIQDLAIRLWLRKETGSAGLVTYLKAFRQILAM